MLGFGDTEKWENRCQLMAFKVTGAQFKKNAERALWEERHVLYLVGKLRQKKVLISCQNLRFLSTDFIEDI